AIVSAVTYYNDAKIIAEVSEDLGEPMTGINCDFEKFTQRGW
ncbi:pyridoxal 5'-phosphate synthase lyase subunit PdxS, partial [Francisella tularensis subsp. holarctica]|nr:pyridoxal 5'-phosphate synthase lyase subunit PdxS [Francisella tularensis subsp. holarctica]